MAVKPKCEDCGTRMDLDDEKDMGEKYYRGYVCPKCKKMYNTWTKKRKKKEK